MTAPACKSDVTKYFENENRPFSVSDVCNVLKSYGKTLINKTMDELVDDGVLAVKVYSKQKVYVFDQSKLPAFEDSELKSMEAEISVLTSQLTKEEGVLKSLQHELKSVKSGLTKEEAELELKRINCELGTVEDRVNRLQNKGQCVSSEDFDSVLRSRSRFLSEWRKRKRLAMDIVDAVAEGYPKSKKQLLADIGLETDEECGVAMPSD